MFSCQYLKTLTWPLCSTMPMATSDILKYLNNMQLHLRAVVPLMKLLVFVWSSREVYFELKLSTKKFVFCNKLNSRSTATSQAFSLQTLPFIFRSLFRHALTTWPSRTCKVDWHRKRTISCGVDCATRVVQTFEQCCAQKTVFKISSAFTRMFMNSRTEAAVLILNFRALVLQERVAVTRALAFANISGLKQMVLRRHPKKKLCGNMGVAKFVYRRWQPDDDRSFAKVVKAATKKYNVYTQSSHREVIIH